MLQISVPTLLLDQVKAKRNISNMLTKANQNGLKFRPHFKTHQSVEIGNWFMESGVDRIAVSNLRMAEKFAMAGWNDILVAIPYNLNEIDRINILAERINLTLVVDCDVPVAMLNRELKFPVGVYIEIDTGYHRTGIDVQDVEAINRTLERIDQYELIKFQGFMLHAGESYKVNNGSPQANKIEILAIHQNNLKVLDSLYNQHVIKYPDLQISYGDTPSCTIADEFGVVTEIRPGNFIFFDLTMLELGVCEQNDIAVAMACPVIGVNYKRHEIAIYGGAVHFSKDSQVVDNVNIFGRMVQSFSRGWGDIIPDAVVKGLSQEHGILLLKNDIAFRRIGVGDIVTILPVHSCLTADSMREYLTLDGTKIII